MDKTGILIAADVDTAEVTKKLSELQNKLKGMMGAQATLGDSPRDMQMKQAFQRSEGIYRDQMKRKYEEQGKILNDLLKKERELGKELDGKVKNQEKLNQLQQEYLQTTNEIRQAKSNQQNALQNICPPGMRYNPQTKTCDPILPGGGGGPIPPGGGGGYRGQLFNPKLFGIPGAVIGAAGSMIGYGTNIAAQEMTKEGRQAGARANIASVIGEAATLQQQRRGYEMDFFKQERADAAKASMKKMEAMRLEDKGGILTQTLVGAGAGATYGGVKGAAYGMGAGSIVPGAGTAVGGVIGGTVGAISGGIIGAGTGFANAMLDERKRSMLFDPEAYKQFVGAGGAEEYKKTMESYKAQNFSKIKAQEYFERNKDNMIRMQRAFGLSDEELFGGEESLYQRAARAGFTENEINRSAIGIQQAGGTTRAGIEGGVYAAQMERGLDLTNASSLIGKISGRTGMGGAESKDEIIRMYAEATRIGLDESEVRGLLETSATMALESGVSADEIQQALQSGLMVQSQRGIQAAQGAFERIKGKTGQMGGTRGQFALAEFGSDEMTDILREAGGEGTKGFSFRESAMLVGTSVDEFSSDNKAIRGLLLKRGIDPDSEAGQKVIAKMKQRSMRSTISNKGREGAFENLRKAKERMAGPLSPEAMKEAQDKYDIAVSEAEQFGFVEEGESYGNMDLLQRESYNMQMARGLKGKVPGKSADTKAVEDRMEDVGGRAFDQSLNRASKDFQAELKRLTKQLEEDGGELRAAFKRISSAREIDELLATMDKLSEAGDLSADVQKAYNKEIQQRVNALNEKEFNDQFFGSGRSDYVQFGAPDNTGD